jgi:hypothetical protein
MDVRRKHVSSGTWTPLAVLLLCGALPEPTCCTGASVQSGVRLQLQAQQRGRLESLPLSSSLSARSATSRATRVATPPLRLSGGADEDSDSDSEEVARAPRIAAAGATAPADASSAAPASATVSDGAADRVLELVKDKQTQLDKDKVFAGLRSLYLNKVKPLEEASWYSFFQPGATLDASDFDAKPIVLLLGQYSVGKTSFIRSLLGRDFAGMRIGPEPTTDQFMAVMHGTDEQVVPGHALCMRKDSPFHGLADFGNNFLSRFAGATSPSPLLANITLIDTPGVLSGRKQRDGRDYDYAAVVEWFASRADMIIFMFDAHKLDISDELRSVIDKLKPHQVLPPQRVSP